MQKDSLLLLLHQLANRRLTQDNVQLQGQCFDQNQIMKKLERERDGYIRQALVMTMKVGICPLQLSYLTFFFSLFACTLDL